MNIEGAIKKIKEYADDPDEAIRRSASIEIYSDPRPEDIEDDFVDGCFRFRVTKDAIYATRVATESPFKRVGKPVEND